MYILSSKTNIIRGFVSGLLLIMCHCIYGQTYPVRINITVIPPYTSSITDYVNTPNKIIATITNLGLGNSDIDIYLKGQITSDGGIEIKTSDSYKPASSIHIPGGSTYTLTPQNISDMFDVNLLDVKGIDIKNLMNGAGLPEDNYQICVRAYDYFTNQPVSDEEPIGCSNYFMITNLETPIITTPFCGDTVNISPVQNVMISWTIPAGAIGAQYKFEMIEIPEGIGIDPNNAFQSKAFPVILEETLPANIINLTADKALLTPGYTYAFRVQATDPFNKLSFRNSGYSEVCYFVCKNEQASEITSFTGNVELSEELEDLENQFKLIPATSISGRLLAKFPDNPNDGILLPDNLGSSKQIIIDPNELNKKTEVPLSNPSQNSGETKQGLSYDKVSETGISVKSDANLISNSSGGSGIVASDNVAAGLVNAVERKPYYYYGNTEEIVNTKPLADMEIRLVARWAFNTAGAQWGIGTPEYRNLKLGETFDFVDINGNTRNPLHVVNMVLATTTTDESGNFTFDFVSDFCTGNSIVTGYGEGYIEKDMYEMNPLDKLGWGMDEVFPGANIDVTANVLNENQDGVSQGQFSVNTMTASEVMNQYNSLANQQNLAGQGQQHAGGQQAMSYNMGGKGQYAAYVCLKIEVVNQKFCSPDIDIFAMPGDVLEVPTQAAKLKTYNLAVKAVSSDDSFQVVGKNKPMDNVKVHIFRDMKDTDEEVPLILDYEGQRLKTQTVNQDGAFKDVAFDTTSSGSDGTVYIKNLVRHAYFDPQYQIEVYTRNINEADLEYENTLYNYETVTDEIPTSDKNDALNNYTPQYSGYRYVTYNRYYEIPEITYTATMKPRFPEIKGRAMAQSNIENNGMDGVRVQLCNQDNENNTYSSGLDFWLKLNSHKGISLEQDKETQDNGFFRFDNLYLLVNEGSIQGPYRRILLTHPSYQSEIRPVAGEPAWNLQKGTLVDIKDVNMKPARLIKGYVVDEEGVPVIAYVKTDYSPFYTTESQNYEGSIQQFFKVPSKFLDKNHLIIHPKSSQYFKFDTLIGDNINKTYKITVYKKLHRPKIVVVNEGGSPVQGAVVELGEQSPKTTNNDGIAEFKYASPGSQIIIKIKPPAGYAPIQEPINIPVTPHDTIFKYVLEYGKTIQGTVTEKTSNEPIQGAIVYSELENTDGTILYVEAESGSDGKYILSGIPKSFNTIEVFAVKKGDNPSYAGTSQTINFANEPASMMPKKYDFKLRKMEDWDLSSIWGYPVVINGFRQAKNSSDEYLIDGYFYDPPVVEGLTLQQQDLKLAFKYLRIKKAADNKIEPVEPTIELDANKIPLTINQTFTGTLYNQKQVSLGNTGFVMNSLGLHEITKNDDKAVLQGILKLNLSSFNFAYNFNGELYAGNKEFENKVEAFSKPILLNTGVQVSNQNLKAGLKNKSQITFLPRLEIFSLNNQFHPVPIENYEVLGFKASSSDNGAFLMNDKIWISTILHTDIPTCNTCSNLDLKIRVGNIVVSKNDINLVKLPSDTLNFELENWKVNNLKEWDFNKNEDAIVLKEAMILTGKGINAKIKNLKIRPNYLGEGEIEMTGDALTLGGIAKIKLNKDLKPVFNYDNTGHYRISFVGTTSANKPAGTVEQLPAMKNGDRIKFESIGLLSNGNDILTINQRIKFYNIMDLSVSSIVSGSNNFMLQGMPDFGIPDFIPEIAIMEYKLDDKGDIEALLHPVNGKVEPPGHVIFTLDPESQDIQEDLFTSFGEITVRQGTGNDQGKFSFRAELSSTPDDCRIDLKVDNTGDQIQNFQVGSNTLKVFEGSMQTTNNNSEWDNLKFKANTTQIAGLNKEGSDNVLDFTVDGTVKASCQSLEVSNINVGLGKMNVTYDFNKGQLYGNLQLHNIELGYGYLKEGEMSVLFDHDGYYLSCYTDIWLLHLFWADCGFIFGNSNHVQTKDITILTQNFKSRYKPDLSSIKGFYCIGEFKPIDINEKILKVIPVVVSAGMGSYYQGSLNDDDKKITIGGYLFGDVEGGVSFKVCKVGVNFHTLGELKGDYTLGTTDINLNGCIQGGFSVNACKIEGSLDFHVNANCQYNDDFDLNLDYGWSSCKK